ncbi:MAG: GIY-YIG nuclease family protein [Roseiarcus sp.]
MAVAKEPPFETASLRKGLHAFAKLKYPNENSEHNIGWFKWGVYIFYDYDLEPIYVGQTNEKISGRISRHLTNQRTDAVAMSVLDPFEVFEIEVYPLPEYQGVNSKHRDFKTAKTHLDPLEYFVHQKAIGESKFKAILNEKDPERPRLTIVPPKPRRERIVSDEVFKLRSHPDVRIARRAQTIAKLAQVISERDIQKHGGLRRVLLVQSRRLGSLAKERFVSLGGEALVEHGSESEGVENDDD